MNASSLFNRATFAVPLLLALGVFGGCQANEDIGTALVPKGTTSLILTALTPVGTPGAPLDLTDAANQKVRLRVEAQDAYGVKTQDYKARLRFNAAVGLLKAGAAEGCLDDGLTVPNCVEQNVDFKGTGQAEVELTLSRGMGALRITAVDQDTYISGASEPIYTPPATLRAMQEPISIAFSDASPWVNSYLRFESGTLVVTQADIGGVYVTDIDGADDMAYSHAYLYTRGIPELSRGDVLDWLGGTVSEYYRFTELSFTAWQVRCNGHALPEPVLLTPELLSSEETMERYESGLVAVENVKVATPVDAYSFTNFGQWAAVLSDGSTKITVLATAAMPDFDPNTYTGTFTKLVGNLKQHRSAKPTWILVPRDGCDIYGYAAQPRPSSCDATLPPSNCGKSGN